MHHYYTMFGVGDYTFAPYKVVWREQASSLTVAVVGNIEGRCVIPDHKLMLIDCNTKQETYYLSGMLNSSLARYVAVSYAITIQFDPTSFKTSASPNSTPKIIYTLNFLNFQKKHILLQRIATNRLSRLLKKRLMNSLPKSGDSPRKN